MKIAFLGNFGPVHSTESHHAWTFEKLGHQVIRLQENSTTTDAVVEACKGAQLFQWTHTHSWGTPGSFSTEEMLNRIHSLGVKSFSYHLDVYFGLNAWDRRDELVGKHASWKTQYWFSTVGSKNEEFKRRGVNHFWKRPGVVEYGCYKGMPQHQFMCDVAFCGSVNYHPEYSFRPRMVRELQQRYGSRFRIFQGVRERALNDLYASVKVLVGDHCFAGEPRYWSDRCPESCGRGGFLLYPETEGLCIPVATYKPQDVDDLCDKIDWYLAHEQEREQIRSLCQQHVREHDTYTVILQEVLKEMGF